MIKLMIVECMEENCKKIIGCIVEASLTSVKTECIGCDQMPFCRVAESKHIFDISHGLCQSCLKKRVEEVEEEETSSAWQKTVERGILNTSKRLQEMK